MTPACVSAAAHRRRPQYTHSVSGGAPAAVAAVQIQILLTARRLRATRPSLCGRRCVYVPPRLRHCLGAGRDGPCPDRPRCEIFFQGRKIVVRHPRSTAYVAITQFARQNIPCAEKARARVLVREPIRVLRRNVRRKGKKQALSSSFRQNCVRMTPRDDPCAANDERAKTLRGKRSSNIPE